jgi:hypothetical protein
MTGQAKRDYAEDHVENEEVVRRRRLPGRLIALSIFVVIAAALTGLVVARDLPEPLRGIQAALVDNPVTGSGEGAAGVLRLAAGVASSAQVNANRANAWLTSRGVEQAALPAAAQAYRYQFGHGLDEDLEEYGPDVEAWLASWQAAYNRGEPWARGMVQQ